MGSSSSPQRATSHTPHSSAAKQRSSEAAKHMSAEHVPAHRTHVRAPIAAHLVRHAQSHAMCALQLRERQRFAPRRRLCVGGQGERGPTDRSGRGVRCFRPSRRRRGGKQGGGGKGTAACACGLRRLLSMRFRCLGRRLSCRLHKAAVQFARSVVGHAQIQAGGKARQAVERALACVSACG